jgi:peroxiredoxin
MRKRVQGQTVVLGAIFAVAALIGIEYVLRGVRPAPPEPEEQPEIVAEQPKAVKSNGLAKGSLAPDFELPDDQGRVRRLRDFAGKKLILSFYCGCARCGLMAQGIHKIEELLVEGARPETVAVVTMEPAALPRWREDSGFEGKFLVADKKSPVIATYHGYPCPRVYVLDEDQRILHSTPEPSESMSMDPAEIMNPIAHAVESPYMITPRQMTAPGPQPGGQPQGH